VHQGRLPPTCTLQSLTQTIADIARSSGTPVELHVFIHVMKLTCYVPTADFPPKARPGRLTTTAATVAAALVWILSAATYSVSVVSPAIASSVPPPGATTYGNDISWPQCPKSNGGYGLPGPMTSASFIVLGLTNGGSFRANPCLEHEVESAKISHIWVGAYAISTYPTSEQLTRYGGAGKLLKRLERVGAAQAMFNLTTMAQVGLRPPMVWVDVEPNNRTPWSPNTADNNAVINGVISRYQAMGVRAGIYSFDKAWTTVTGDRALPSTPTWVSVGQENKAAATANCNVASYAGQKPWLSQWTDGVRDYNLTCPGVTGWAATGNLLTPYLNVALTTGSRGSAVAALQRRLGVLNTTGTFGPATRAKVISSSSPITCQLTASWAPPCGEP
jgi:hypothetical protein